METEEWKKIFETYRDDKGMTPLHYAASYGCNDICNYLIETLGMDTEIKDFDGNTVLILAVCNDQISTVEYLIDKGANICSINEAGATALHFADGKEMVTFLISKGADVDAPSAIGTPLQHAAQLGKKKVVEMLLENHADINAGLEGSLTPLMLAVRAKSTECIKLLIEAGADPNIGANGYNTSPLCWAASMDDGLIINCLVEAQPEADFNFTDAVSFGIVVSNFPGAITLLSNMKNPPSSLMSVATYVHTADFWKEADDCKTVIFQETKAKGEDALKVKKYGVAINWFCLAEMAKPNDATISSYLSLCWACLHHASFALRCAQDSVQSSPLWSKAHLRAGVAWRLLKNHQKATESFKKAFELDPKEKELREAMEAKDDDLVTVARKKSRFLEVVTCIGMQTLQYQELESMLKEKTQR